MVYSLKSPLNQDIAPENGWLEHDPFLLWPGLFSQPVAVTLKEGNSGDQSTIVGR